MPKHGNGADRTFATKRMNRRRFLAGAGAAGIIGLSGCLGGGNNGGSSNNTDSGGGGGGATTSTGEWGDFSGKTVHVVAESPGQGMTEAYDKIANEFQKATGAKVNMDYTEAGAGTGERVAQLISAGNPPEVIHSTQLEAVKFLNQDVLQPIGDTLDAVSESWGEVGEPIRLTANDQDYMVPMYLERGIDWRRDDVYEANPSTWEEEVAEAKRVDGTNGLNGYYVGAGNDVCNQIQIHSRLRENGARMYHRKDDEIQIAIDDGGENKQLWIETLNHLKRLHKYSPKAADASCGSLSNAIPSGQSAAGWYVGFRPKLIAGRQNKSFAKNVRPYFPKQSDEALTHGQSVGWVQGKGADATDAAREWMRFAYQPEYWTDFMMSVPIHNIPAFPKVRNGDAYQQALQQFVEESSGHSMDVIQQFFDLTVERGMNPAIAVEGGNPYAGTLMFGSDIITRPVQEVLLNDVDPATAVENVHQTAVNALEQAKS
ncbi:ABC transporter substrate-binding protein [Halomarina salina]|uniref:ABC transporter substrate-binding protein n=1 Tax=Halomarina salina TaxID=1872699 RepID=A0ABD5RV08_9EURY|nr:extracellular solute-binding protein [Halomarina salina]